MIMRLPKQSPTVLHVPAPLLRDGDIGLGDVLKKITTTFGVRPCAPCEARAANLNGRIVFSARRDQAQG
jgi:hypothetical protein